MSHVPEVGLLEVMLKFHAAAEEVVAACEDVHLARSGEGKGEGDREGVLRGDHESQLHRFAALFKEMWRRRIDEVGEAIGETSTAQCHHQSTVTEVHELTSKLFSLNTCESCVLGDTIMSSARLVYSCILPHRLRGPLCKRWMAILEENGVPAQFTDLMAYCDSCFPGRPPASHAQPRDMLESVCAAWIAEEASAHWPLIIDPLGAVQEWYVRRGFQSWDVSSVAVRETVLLIESAATSGTQLLLCGDVAQVMVPAVCAYLKKRHFHPSFRIAISSTEPNYYGLIHTLRGLVTPIVNEMSSSSCVRHFLPCIVKVLEPALHSQYIKTSQAAREAEKLLKGTETQLLSAINANTATPTSNETDVEQLQAIRGVIKHRTQCLAKLTEVCTAVERRVEYFYPVAARVWRLRQWLGTRMNVAEFGEAVSSRLSAHLIRPPTLLFATEKFDEEVCALVECVVGTCDGLYSYSNIEASLRSEPQFPKLHAASIAHSLTASFLSTTEHFTHILCAAHDSFVKKDISEHEFTALLMHHPVRSVSESELAKDCQKRIAVLAATRNLLKPGSADDTTGGALKQLSRWVEFIGRGREMKRRWGEGQCDEVRGVALLALWAASHHCKHDFVDRAALRTYGQELLRLARTVETAIISMSNSVMKNMNTVLDLLRSIATELSQDAQRLTILVSNDIQEGYVHDLDRYMEDAVSLKERYRRLGVYEETLGVNMLDSGELLVLEALLESKNYPVPASGTHHTCLTEDNRKIKVAKTLNRLLRIDERCADVEDQSTDPCAASCTLLPASAVNEMTQNERNEIAANEIMLTGS